MGTLYLYNGQLLSVNGALATSITCCCFPPPPCVSAIIDPFDSGTIPAQSSNQYAQTLADVLRNSREMEKTGGSATRWLLANSAITFRILDPNSTTPHIWVIRYDGSANGLSSDLFNPTVTATLSVCYNYIALVGISNNFHGKQCVTTLKWQTTNLSYSTTLLTLNLNVINNVALIPLANFGAIDLSKLAFIGFRFNGLTNLNGALGTDYVINTISFSR